MGRNAIPPKVRWQVFARDGFRCRYCGAQPPDCALVIDHAYPVARGGTDHPKNLITACEECNQGKADALVPTLGEFELYHTAARIAAVWLLRVWRDCVRGHDDKRVPAIAALVAVVRDSRTYDDAVDVVRDVAERYLNGYFGNWAWPDSPEPGITVNDVLVGFADWCNAFLDNDTDEPFDEYRARYWDEVPF